MPNEVCYLLAADGSVLWREVGLPSSMPDSRARWEAIWRLRERVAEIAHTHPGGPLAFSVEDLTTMDAVDSALGRRLGYWIVTPDNLLHRGADGEIMVEVGEPQWVAEIRAEEVAHGDPEHHVPGPLG
jgi:proteasome lid subunit RPN8/RPN11